jgi:hypothetical protein
MMSETLKCEVAETHKCEVAETLTRVLGGEACKQGLQG